MRVPFAAQIECILGCFLCEVKQVCVCRMMVAGLVAGIPGLNPGHEIGGSSPTHSARFPLRLRK